MTAGLLHVHVSRLIEKTIIDSGKLLLEDKINIK